MKVTGYIGNQGDVLVAKIEELPGDLFQDDQCKKGILVFGELSGHVHELEDLDFVSVYRSSQEKYAGLMFLDVKKEVRLRHGKQENFKGREADQDYHKPATLPPGTYVTGIVPETDHLSGVIRKVVD